ncbi:hypothetical protein [Leptolyngbya sp. BC1307]|jgi:hypothetical protein|uniref:hypothetical protein n=1 Tax=Leptolyngbya sp. BC1307 TaxID=2029589 RepID=UPI000EFB413B|nr:hypothetical protein [Leptolyngbya sp. BC1307]
MASRTEVKNYLAHWFQLGKQIVSNDGRAIYKLEKIIQGDRFSPEFEACWTDILKGEGKGCYLIGTDQTIAELLSSEWDFESCARCSMPAPLSQSQLSTRPCPCDDLSNWPNVDLPHPRLPVDSHRHLGQMNDRLQSRN